LHAALAINAKTKLSTFLRLFQLRSHNLS